MEIAFRLVDVFTDRPLAGNQLCVVPDPPPGLDDELMQQLAREIGFSETTFVTEVAAHGLYLFAVAEDGEATARMFAAGLGVPEDAATGSAAGPLGAYLSNAGVAAMPGRLVVRQGEQIGRPSELQVDVRERDGAFE